MSTPRPLPIVGGHLALDFANTVDDPLGPERHDHLVSYDDLLRWSVRAGSLSADQAKVCAGLAQQHPRAAAAALRRALALRQALNAVFGAVVAVRPLPEDSWATLRRDAADGLSRAAPTPSRLGYGLTWPDDEMPAPLWPVADAAVALLRSADLGRVKQCAGCPWLFLDSSRNGSRRWCSMDDCGTHEKVKRYVAKRAASRR